MPEAVCGVGRRQAEGLCCQVHSTVNWGQRHTGLFCPLPITHPEPGHLLGEGSVVQKHVFLNFREDWPSGFMRELKIADKTGRLSNPLCNKWEAKIKRGRTFIQGNTARQWQHQARNSNFWLPVHVSSPLSSPILWLLKTHKALFTTFLGF